MKFNDYLIKNQIQEWKHYYINFDVLNRHLKVLRFFRHRLNFRDGDAKIHNFSESEIKFVEDVDRHFLRALEDQLLKFHAFISYKQNFYLAPLLIKFVYNIRNFREHCQFEPDGDEVAQALQHELEKFYKELAMVRQFMALNFLIYERLCKRYKVEFERLNMFDPAPIEAINLSFKEARADSIYKKLDAYSKITATLYQENFFGSRQVKEAHKRLEMTRVKDHLTYKESFYFGFYIGAFSICIILIATLLTETKLFDNSGSDFITFMFPIFRGTLMLYLYWFLFGVDVYVWDRYNINFRRVFDVQRQMTSSAFQIMKRAFGFLACWIVIFSYCALSNTQFFDSALIFNKVTSMYVAPIVWLVFFMYLFFPSTRLFHYQGRMYFFHVLWEVISGPFGRLSTRQSWCMTQLLSFLIVIKDLLYTFCYLENVYEVGTIKNTCFDSLRFTEFMVVFVICTWKNIFGVNKFVYLYKDRAKLSEADFKEKRFAGIRGMTKGLYMTINAIIAYNHKQWPPIWRSIWIANTAILTVWACRDDLIDDWGFLQTKDLLRLKLAYPKKRVYYLAMALNVVLRLSWVITLSPSILSTTLSKNVVGLATTILESFRSTVWNFFKVENDHLKYQGNFNFINSYSFPYDFEIDMSNPEVRMNVASQVRILLKNAFIKRDLFGSTWDADMSLSAVEPVARENSVARGSRASELGNLAYKSEKEHKIELERFDESLTECALFKGRARALKMGMEVAKLGPEVLARFSGRLSIPAAIKQSPQPPSAFREQVPDHTEQILNSTRDLEKGLIEFRK